MFKKFFFLFIVIPILVVVGIAGYQQHTAGAQNALSHPYAGGDNLVVQISHINLKTNDLVYDPAGDKIYASIPGTVPEIGNRVVSIDSSTLEIGNSIFVGSEPNKLAISDDGQFLYAGIDGAGAIRRVNVISQTADIQFALGSGFCGTYLAEDIVVLPGLAESIAVSKRNNGCSPRHEGVAIYDNGVQRPTMTPGHTGSNVIEPSDTSEILYGYNNETSEFGFRVMSVISTGVEVSSTTTGLISGYGPDILFESGLIYASTGAVIDPVSRTLVGSYSASGLVQADSSVGRVYFLSVYGEWVFRVFDQDTFVLLNSFPISDILGEPSSLIKVGANSFAFRTSGDQVYLVKVIEMIHSVHLPVITHQVFVPPPQGIYGQVTQNGTPASNIYLELRFYNGSSWSTFTSATTDAQGKFSFLNLPSLGVGQTYYVLYKNTDGVPGRLWVWGTNGLTSYTSGASVNVGIFDIDDIPLLAPANGAYLDMPVTFQWVPRPATSTDSYEFNLYDYEDGDPYFFTDPPLGYVGGYLLNSLPGGFATDSWYVWEMWVYSPDGGFGISYEARYVAFSSEDLGYRIQTIPVIRTPASFSEALLIK